MFQISTLVILSLALIGCVNAGVATTTTTKTTTTVAPSPSGSVCKVFAQCGGPGWTGCTVCPTGSRCYPEYESRTFTCYPNNITPRSEATGAL